MKDFLTAHHALADWSSKSPNREFLVQPVDGGTVTLSFADALDQASRMAAALIGLGLTPGDRVAILGKNSAEWVLADLAIAMAGLVSAWPENTAVVNRQASGRQQVVQAQVADKLIIEVSSIGGRISPLSSVDAPLGPGSFFCAFAHGKAVVVDPACLQ